MAMRREPGGECPSPSRQRRPHRRGGRVDCRSSAGPRPFDKLRAGRSTSAPLHFRTSRRASVSGRLRARKRRQKKDLNQNSCTLAGRHVAKDPRFNFERRPASARADARPRESIAAARAGRRRGISRDVFFAQLKKSLAGERGEQARAPELPVASLSARLRRAPAVPWPERFHRRALRASARGAGRSWAAGCGRGGRRAEDRASPHAAANRGIVPRLVSGSRGASPVHRSVRQWQASASS